MSRWPISGSSSPVSGQSNFRAAPLAAYLSQQNGAIGSLGLTPSALEVLLCIAFKQPISQAEIDRLFDVDKRGLVVKLRDLAHPLDHAPDAVVLRAGADLHFSRIFFGAVPLDGTGCFLAATGQTEKFKKFL